MQDMRTLVLLGHRRSCERKQSNRIQKEDAARQEEELAIAEKREQIARLMARNPRGELYR